MMTGTYNMSLVALSYVVAVAASYTALELSARVVKHKDKLEEYWLIAGALSMGVGIWTMHFVGMLAYEMPMNYSYSIQVN